MSSPRLAPWLIPETIRSGRSPNSPRSAKRTQSTGVPSVAKPRLPSPNSTSSTSSGERVVMLRAVARAVRVGRDHVDLDPLGRVQLAPRACRPSAVIPSSFVSRTRTGAILRGAGSGSPRVALASCRPWEVCGRRTRQGEHDGRRRPCGACGESPTPHRKQSGTRRKNAQTGQETPAIDACSVADRRQIEAVRGRRLPCLGARAALEQRLERAHDRACPAATGSIVPTSTRTMLRMKASASIQSTRTPPSRSSHSARSTSRSKRTCSVWVGRERGEVVASRRSPRRRLERCAVERLRPPQRPPALERARGRAARARGSSRSASGRRGGRRSRRRRPRRR